MYVDLPGRLLPALLATLCLVVYGCGTEPNAASPSRASRPMTTVPSHLQSHTAAAKRRSVSACRSWEAASVSWVGTRSGWLLLERPCTGRPYQRALARTADSGRHWRQVKVPARVSTKAAVRDLAMTASGDGYLYDPATWATTDGGRHWQRLPGRSTESLAIDGPKTYRIAYRGSGCPGPCHSVIQEAATGSGHWRTVDRPGFFGFGGAITASGEVVLVTFFGHPAGGEPDAHTTYVESTNGGQTWRTYADPCGGRGSHEWDTTAVALSGQTIAAVCARRIGPGNALVVSSDAGASFTDRRPTPVPFVGAVADSAPRIIAGTGAIGGQGHVRYLVASTTNSGLAWRTSVRDSAPAGDVDVDVSAAIECASGGCVYLGDPRRLYVSTDGGASWTGRPI